MITRYQATKLGIMRYTQLWMIFASIFWLAHGFGPLRPIKNSLALGGQVSASETTKQEESLPLPPGNKRGRWPILGDTLRLLNPSTMASYQVDSGNKYGPIWKTSVLFQPAVFVSSASYMEQLTREEARKPTSASFPPHHRKLFGSSSVLVTSGEQHDQTRRLMQPALSPDAIQSYQPFIQEAVFDFMQDCREMNTTGVFPLVDALRRFTVRVSLRVLLGDEASQTSETILDDLIQDIGIWSKGIVSAPLTFLPWTLAGRAMRARRRISDRLSEWIQEERRDPTLGATSLLHRLVYSQDSNGNNGLSDEDIIDNVLTLIFAGSDTTASVLTSAFLELSLNSTLENTLRHVCESSKSTEATTELIEALLFETQRAHPAAPFTMRVVDADDLHVGGYRVPKGWLVAYAIAGTLLGDNDTYPLPNTFDIDRWLEGDAPPIWAFGGGKRMCPGKTLSIVESTALFKQVLGDNSFRWQLDPDQNYSYRYTPGFFPVDGLKVHLL